MRACCCLLVMLSACSDAGDGAGSAEPVSFARDVHPILLARCSGSSCHGVPMGGFRPGHAAADAAAAYEATQQQGLNGQPVYERILARTSSTDPNQIMPPPFATPPCNGVIGSPGCLTRDELQLIEDWVAQGAPP